jgi:hypothetical protein
MDMVKNYILIIGFIKGFLLMGKLMANMKYKKDWKSLIIRNIIILFIMKMELKILNIIVYN